MIAEVKREDGERAAETIIIDLGLSWQKKGGGKGSSEKQKQQHQSEPVPLSPLATS